MEINGKPVVFKLAELLCLPGNALQFGGDSVRLLMILTEPAGYWILVTGYWMLVTCMDTADWLLVTGYWILGEKFQLMSNDQ